MAQTTGLASSGHDSVVTVHLPPSKHIEPKYNKHWLVKKNTKEKRNTY